MNLLARIFQKQTGFLRGLKASYIINNVLHWRSLRRNKALYVKYGLDKSVFAPISYSDFKGKVSEPLPWLDRPDALAALEAHPDFIAFDVKSQDELRRFIRNGYMVFEDFIDLDTVDKLNTEVDALLAKGQTGFNYTGRKLIELHTQSALANTSFFRNERLLRLFKFVMQKEIIPFQTLNFIQGSEQHVHSDSIHMMTEPPGYMIAAWFALEDCTVDNGPLVYYPGSHRLPYITTSDYPSGNTVLTIGAQSNERYEEKIEEVIVSAGFEKQHFLAKKGSVLIWHANLVHGGSPIHNPATTRKSMVCHYFAADVICYHEMSQRPAILPEP
jgi:ectoine hydroxylase